MSASGGSAIAEITTEGKGQGNGGVSLPCRVCYITAVAGAGPNIRMLIDRELSAAEITADFLGSTEKGVEVPTHNSGKHLVVAIDDVSKLWFYSTLAGDLVNITYRT